MQLDAHGHRCVPVRIRVCSRVSGALTPEQLVLDRDWWCAPLLRGLANSVRNLPVTPDRAAASATPWPEVGAGEAVFQSSTLRVWTSLPRGVVV